MKGISLSVLGMINGMFRKEQVMFVRLIGSKVISLLVKS